MELKSYTFIVVESWMSGSHKQQITSFRRIRTNDLKHAVDSFEGQVQIVFCGHPPLDGEIGIERIPVTDFIIGSEVTNQK